MVPSAGDSMQMLAALGIATLQISDRRRGELDPGGKLLLRQSLSFSQLADCTAWERQLRGRHLVRLQLGHASIFTDYRNGVPLTYVYGTP